MNEEEKPLKDAPKAPAPSPKIYQVHNTSRSRLNRTQRAAAAEHGGHKQYIGGEHRLVRGRPVFFSEEQVLLHLDELLRKESTGLIEVRGPDGRKIDLKTGDSIGTSPAIPALKVTRLDSIAYDTPSGIPMPQFPGGQAEIPNESDQTLPDLVARTSREEDSKNDGTATPRGGGKRKNK